MELLSTPPKGRATLQQMFFAFFVFFMVIQGLATLVSYEPSTAKAQDASVSATQSEMYAAMGKITFFAETTTGVGSIDSSQPLMTVNIRNDSDYPLTIRSFSVIFEVSGEIMAWPSIDGSPMTYRMLFTAPAGQDITMTFPNPGYHVIEPHTTSRLDLFAVIPGVPKGTIASATTLAQVEFLLGPWMQSRVTNLPCRNWRVE